MHRLNDSSPPAASAAAGSGVRDVYGEARGWRKTTSLVLYARPSPPATPSVSGPGCLMGVRGLNSTKGVVELLLLPFRGS
ncbi:unnamed protein product [Boreogadus saida]